VKPGDHPEFFRFPAPEGRSRESTIVLRADGTFSHDGEPVRHPKLAEAMHRWISRHPDDGRYILTNGYDWTYFTVEDAPYTVLAIKDQAGTPVARLSDGSEEPLDPDTVRVATDHSLYARVKASSPHGPFEARFSRHAQAADLAPFLAESASDPGSASLVVGGRAFPILSR
jgi:hypothetical protein